MKTMKTPPTPEQIEFERKIHQALAANDTRTVIALMLEPVTDPKALREHEEWREQARRFLKTPLARGPSTWQKNNIPK